VGKEIADVELGREVDERDALVDQDLLLVEVAVHDGRARPVALELGEHVSDGPRDGR
jgi:hypothetical protein